MSNYYYFFQAKKNRGIADTTATIPISVVAESLSAAETKAVAALWVGKTELKLVAMDEVTELGGQADE